MEDTEYAIEFNERRFQVDKAAELKYKELPALQKKYSEILDRVKNDAYAMVADAVGPEHIAQVVSRWSGIPVQVIVSVLKGNCISFKH